MSFSLPTSVYSLDQLQFCAEELHTHAAALRRTRATHKSDADSPELSLDSRALLGQLPKPKSSDATAVEALAVELESMAAHGARVTITLAALASHRLRETLVTWLRTNLKPNLLVDFHVNPDIAGGMVVRTTNRVYDWSFRHQLLDNPNRFTEILDHVR